MDRRGIYGVWENDKLVYIGSTQICIADRYMWHRKTHKRKSSPFHRYICEKGMSAFRFDMLEETDLRGTALKALEQKWLDKHKTTVLNSNRALGVDPAKITEWQRKHSNYQRDWRAKHPNYQREWRRKRRQRVNAKPEPRDVDDSAPSSDSRDAHDGEGCVQRQTPDATLCPCDVHN